MATQLTEHFTLEELTATGIHQGVDNTPSEATAKNLLLVAQKLEQMRSILRDAYFTDEPVYVHYGYRSDELNSLCGGSPTSAHRFGLAADCAFKGLTIEDVFHVLVRDPHFMEDVDQMILERGCLHVGLLVPGTHPEPRRELRGDAYDPDTGRRTYPLLGIWQPPIGG